MMQKTSGKGKKGFTLIEVICALAVLSLVFLAFTILVTSASRLNLKAGSNKRAFDAGVKNIILEDQTKIENKGVQTIVLKGQGNTEIAVLKVQWYATRTPATDVDQAGQVYLEKFSAIPKVTPP